MEDKLITLAIHTYEKAQILKTILETEGIEVYIHNVNLIQPVVSAGVRVRIKESDLPKALRVIEDSHWLEDNEEDLVEPDKRKKKILIPVDFSDYSLKACEIGFNYAAKIDAEVMILHAYYAPYFPMAVPMGDTLAYQIDDNKELGVILNRVRADMDNIYNYINQKMALGELPKIKYHHVLREGLPEEEIIAFAKEYNPILIIMGTRGNSQKDLDLIGSVTGEVIDHNRIPVLAIPENIHYKDLEEMKNVAFATSYVQQDLVAFDAFMKLIEPYQVKIHLFNISTTRDEWNEIRLTGIQEYLKKQYPDAEIYYTVLDDGDLLQAIDSFVQSKQIDLIALSAKRRNIIARIFNPSIARRMLFHSETPLLVIHAK